MKRKFLAFILLLSAGLSLSSCLDSTDDSTNIVYSHDTAITAFSLGSMDQFGKSKDGQRDSLLRGVVAGADYQFTIDQANRAIYNVDSLPVNTRIAAVLATITAKNSNYIRISYNKQQQADGEDNDSLVLYSSTDSIDFTKTKEKALVVYAQDLKAYAEYTVKVNVHTQRPDTFIWHSLASEEVPALAKLTAMKAVTVGNHVVIFGKDEEGKLKVCKSDNGSDWNTVDPIDKLGNDAVDNVVAFGGSLYVLNPETHQLLKSSDGTQWELVSTNASLCRLLGAGSKMLYAYTGATTPTGIAVSSDNGATWTAEQIDADAKYLPVSSVNMSYASVRSTKGAENVLLIGNRNSSEETDTIASVWHRTIDPDNAAAGSKWSFVEYDNNQARKMPKLDEIALAKTDDSYVVLGSNGKWYESIDGGISWSVDTLISMPPHFDTSKAFAFVRVKEASVAPDGTHYDSYIYWLVNNGYVWKGRYNRDGWLRKN